MKKLLDPYDVQNLLASITDTKIKYELEQQL